MLTVLASVVGAYAGVAFGLAIVAAVIERQAAATTVGETPNSSST